MSFCFLVTDSWLAAPRQLQDGGWPHTKKIKAGLEGWNFHPQPPTSEKRVLKLEVITSGRGLINHAGLIKQP